MIPKIIHYCWFGPNHKSELENKCIDSWKKYCPQYQIIEWNENNINFSDVPQYVKDAFNSEKWAFVSDYVRLKVIYNNGGIYLDTDVELVKNIDEVLSNKTFFALGKDLLIGTGLGFGSEKRTVILKELIKQYEKLEFLDKDGEENLIPCSVINDIVFQKHGLKKIDEEQILNNDIHIYPSEYFDTMNFFTNKIKITDKTLAVHHYGASWASNEKRKEWKKMAKHERIHIITRTPNRMLMRMLGIEKYNKLKNMLKKII